MRHILAAWWLVVLSCTVVHAIEVGDSEADVTNALGKPSVTRQMPDGTVRWRYKDGTTVQLRQGRVQEIEVPASAKTVGGPEPKSASSTTAPVATGTLSTVEIPPPTAPDPSARPPAWAAFNEAKFSQLLGPLRLIQVDRDQTRHLFYLDGTEVILVNGVPQKISGPGLAKIEEAINNAAAASSSKPQPPVPAAKQAAPTTITTKPPYSLPIPAAEADRVKSDNSILLGLALIVIGIILVLITRIMFLIVAYRESGWWLIGCLLIPFCTIVFAVTHWDETKKLVAWYYLAALPLLLIGVHLTSS